MKRANGISEGDCPSLLGNYGPIRAEQPATEEEEPTVAHVVSAYLSDINNIVIEFDQAVTVTAEDQPDTSIQVESGGQWHSPEFITGVEGEPNQIVGNFIPDLSGGEAIRIIDQLEQANFGEYQLEVPWSGVL